MSDNQYNHPLQSNPPQQHPLSDIPPEKQKPQGRGIPIPLEAQTPIVTYVLIAINVALFAVRYFMPELSLEMLVGGYTGAEPVFVDQQYYRLITSMFLHFNEMHIAFNMMALYYIGGNLEKLFGHVRFSLIYLLGGLAGSIFPLFFDGAGIGASGAVFAIWATEAVFIYRNRQLFGAAGQARLRNSLVFMGINFLMGFGANAVADTTGGGVRIGNSAHFGGLVAGAILGWLIGPIFKVRRKENPEEGDIPVEIIQTVSLQSKLTDVLFFTIGLVALLLFARLLYS